MQSESNIAFKEWAVVCAALSAGRQTVILRKGGIDEGREGFNVKHDQFWLLPTRFHQDPAQLIPDAQPLWQHARDAAPPLGKFAVDLFAIVQAVFEVHDLAVVQRMAAEHILSAETVRQRFHYRRPGLFVLVVRTYRLSRPHDVADSPYIAGCRSWVELPQPLSTVGAIPALEDDAFSQRLQCMKSLIGN